MTISRWTGVPKQVILTAVLGLLVAGLGYADIQVTVLPSLAPNVYGSPSWLGYTANAVYAIEHGLSSYGDPNSPTYYSQTNHFSANQTIVTGFRSWLGETDPAAEFGAAFANELGNRMHFGFDIKSTDGDTFDANHVSFTSTSNPGGDLDYSWSAGPWSYQPWRIGIAANGTVYKSGEAGNLPVVRMIYVGSGNSLAAYCPSCTTAQQQAEIDATALAGGGYTYTGTYSVTDSRGASFSGSGAFSVAPVPEPSTVVLLGAMIGIAGVLRRRRLCGRVR